MSTPESNSTSPSPRPRSAVDRIADAHVDTMVRLSPLTATALGVEGAHDEIDDLSLAGTTAQVRAAQETLDALDGVPMADDVDAVTVHAMRERLGLEIEQGTRILNGTDPVPLNVLACAVQDVRDIVDLMPKDSASDWETINARLRAVPRALDQFAQALRESTGQGATAALRQVEAVARQCHDQANPDTTTYGALLAEAGSQSEALQQELKSSSARAAEAFGQLGRVLTDEIAPHAPTSDAAGRERYQLASRAFLGSTIDLEETYAWGQDEVVRIRSLMQETAQQIQPGATVKEAVAALDNDPAYRLEGTAALQDWMQAKADQAIDELAGTHFDVPEPVRRIECMIAPTQTGGIYYTGPSEDFSRPGRMWWSVPPSVETFSTWRELTTVYHEGVPGHHLQIGQTAARSELLNRWRRLASWTSGHGEGWALYAEWLMAELGYLDDPGDRMGLLDGQILRAVRVVIDIGVHCGFPAPAEAGGGEWTYDKAWAYLTDHINMDEGFARFELDRYLGWPGQAPSYKIGERLWLGLRAELEQRQGDGFNLAAFHRQALDIGGVDLDTLQAAVLGELSQDR